MGEAACRAGGMSDQAGVDQAGVDQAGRAGQPAVAFRVAPDGVAEPTPAAPRAAAMPTTDGHQTRKYAFIDALRGYAVLLVITCHTGGMFPEMPYPVKKLTNFGWHGVQLFFLVSCVTLLLSWRADEAKGRASAVDFWTRRFFRIAPMYYLAAVFYYAIERPPGGFDLGQLLATVTFVNAWHPDLIPTVPDRWMVVPGGWSIGVEFTFYFVFPVLALSVRSVRAALMFVVLAVLVGCIANPIMADAVRNCCTDLSVREFIYFWFPNQLPVFALGTVLYFALLATWRQPEGRACVMLRRHGTAIVLACIGACIAAANLPFAQSLPFAPPLFVPTLLVASAIFIVFALVLAHHPRSLFVNRAICSLGQVSFSAYLLHFAVVHKLPRLLPGVFDVHAGGWRAIGTLFALWAVAVPVTYGLSLVTFRFIETPMIALGRRVLMIRHARRKMIGSGRRVEVG